MIDRRITHTDRAFIAYARLSVGSLFFVSCLSRFIRLLLVRVVTGLARTGFASPAASLSRPVSCSRRHDAR